MSSLGGSSFGRCINLYGRPYRYHRSRSVWDWMCRHKRGDCCCEASYCSEVVGGKNSKPVSWKVLNLRKGKLQTGGVEN